MPNSWWEKQVKRTSKLWNWSNSAHRRSQPKWQLVQTSYLKRVKLLLFLPYNKHLINRAKSVCMGESWPRSCVQTSLRSVCTYDLGQDSPIQTDLARLIRANYQERTLLSSYVQPSLTSKMSFYNRKTSWLKAELRTFEKPREMLAKH